MTQAEELYANYVRNGKEPSAYDTLRDAALTIYRSADRTSTLMVFDDGSVMEWTAGEDQTYPDLGSVADGYDTLEAFSDAYPTVPVEAQLPSLTCARCGHTWTPRIATPPKQCPHCKQTGWETPARSRVHSLPTRN